MGEDERAEKEKKRGDALTEGCAPSAVGSLDVPTEERGQRRVAAPVCLCPALTVAGALCRHAALRVILAH